MSLKRKNNSWIKNSLHIGHLCTNHCQLFGCHKSELLGFDGMLGFAMVEQFTVWCVNRE